MIRYFCHKIEIIRAFLNHVYDIMWKNTLAPGSPQMTIWFMALHAVYLSLQVHAQNICYLLIFHCNSGCKNVP